MRSMDSRYGLSNTLLEPRVCDRVGQVIDNRAERFHPFAKVAFVFAPLAHAAGVNRLADLLGYFFDSLARLSLDTTL